MKPDRGPLDDWQGVPFRSIAESITERTDDPSASGLEHYVGLEHLDPDSLTISRWGSPSDVEATKLRFRRGDVIYARRRAYQRKLGVAEWEGICSAHALVLRARPEACLPEFLPFFLQSDQFHRRALEISAGSLSPTINWKTLAVQEFALPPVDKQREIAELLQASREVLAALSAAFAAARVHWLALASDALTNPAHRPLETVASVELGKKRDPKLLKEGSPTPYLRAANVKDSTFDLADVLSMNFTPAEVKSFGLQRGDVLVTEGCGSLDQVGACAVWNDDLPAPTCFQMTLLRLRARALEDMPLIQHWAEYSFRAGRFAGVASGTSVFHLSAARVRKMPFPELDRERATDVVSQLDAAKNLERQAADALQLARQMSANLREALLQGVS